ncbi:unnamed protein product [Prunus brigantina]
MWTWGRKTKKGRLAIESESPIEARSSSSVPTEDRPHSDYSLTNFSSSSSSSSAASLKSQIKSSLPENPIIYDMSDIRHALFSSHLGSSSSFRRSLWGKDVVIFQRESGLPLSYSNLHHRLAQISKSHHTSLIKLLGASLSGYYVYLVYEYLPGANLADCLRNPNNPDFTVLSTWLSRMQVAADLADGLNYMHHSSGDNSTFVHNHIKSSSIIVSEQKNLPLRAKICHFGTAWLCGKTQALSSTVEATRVYMAPESQLTHKCDVYAFGVVLLELISGKEPLMDGNGGGGGGGCRRASVIETAREAVSSGGGVRRWVDRRLKDSFPMEVAEKMVNVALECVEEDPDSRPDMGRVAGLDLAGGTLTSWGPESSDFALEGLSNSLFVNEELELLNGPMKVQPEIVREGDGERHQRERERERERGRRRKKGAYNMSYKYQLFTKCIKKVCRKYQVMESSVWCSEYVVKLIAKPQIFHFDRDQFTSFFFLVLPKVIAVSELSRLHASLTKESVPVNRLIVNPILPPSASDCKFCSIKRQVLIYPFSF